MIILYVMQTNPKIQKLAQAEVTNLCRDGYRVCGGSQTKRAGYYELKHLRNGKTLTVEWQTLPLACFSVVSKNKVCKVVYL